MTDMLAKDVRLEGFSTGWNKSWHRATHLPTGTMVQAEAGENLTKAQIWERLRAAVEARPIEDQSE